MPRPIKQIVLQPTSLCNINCIYCYLSERRVNARMPVRVIDRLATDLECLGSPVNLIWHGGEPLTAGIDHFEALVHPLEKLRVRSRVSHSVQTNGTLIKPEWCSFFKKHDFHVGVSIDGPQWANQYRQTHSGAETFNRTMRGIEFLRAANIQFSCICVVTERTVQSPAELYAFFSRLGCAEVGFNLEEKVGANNNLLQSTSLVETFWGELFVAWKANPSVQVREIKRTLRWVSNPDWQETEQSQQDLFPSVAHDGRVVFLSPEFLDAKSTAYNHFLAGNILDESLQTMLERGEKLNYVLDYRRGVMRCFETCEYGHFCRGGQASNKFFETGSTDATVTSHCRNAEQFLLNAVLANL